MLFEIPTICFHYVNVSILIQFSLKTSVLSQLLSNLHKIIGRRCVLESSRRGIHNKLFYGEILEKKITFNHFDSNPRIPHLYYMLG